MKKLLFSCAVLAALASFSCSKDEGTPADPSGTVLLNMLDESNGKTLLGDTGIYIDKGLNFTAYGTSCDIFALGRAGSLGEASVKSLVTRADRVAVQAGHAYLIAHRGVQMQFPSGAYAMKIGDNSINYIKLYAVSTLSQEDKTIGAAVKYVVAQPANHGLPAPETTVLTAYQSDFDRLGDKVALTLPSSDCEYDFRNDGRGVACEKRGQKLYFWLTDWVTGQFKLYLRIGESYTEVYVSIQNY